MTDSVTAIFTNKFEASRAIDDLITQGITEKDISVLMSNTTHGQEFSIEVNTKAPEGAAIGATAGGMIGAIAAGLTAVGSVAMSGGVGVVAVGPIVAAFAGAGLGAATGGLAGGLVGLGFDETEAKLVDQDLENGAILVAAEVSKEQKSAVKETYEKIGAKTIAVH